MKVYKIIALLFFTYFVSAQGDLPSGKIEVIKNFDARLAESEKLNLAAPIQSGQTENKEYQYNVVNRDKVKVDIEPPQLRPVAVSPEKSDDKAYRGMIRAGYGMPLSPLIEANYALIMKPEFSMDVLARHYSANNKKIEWQRFADTDLGLNIGYNHHKGLGIKGDIGYTLNDAFLYGYNQDSLDYTKDQALKRYSNVGVGLRAFNNTRNKLDIDYWAGIKFDHFRDNLATRENDVKIEIGAKKFINKKHPLSLGIISDFTNIRDTLDLDLNNFFILPSFKYQGEGFSVKTGLKIGLINDQFYFLPDLEASARVVGNKWIVFAGWEGNINKNTYKSLASFNPYIHPNQSYKNSHQSEIYGGFRGNVWDLNYEAKAGYRKVNNLAYFTQDRQDSRFFKVGYDTATFIFVNGQVGTQVLQNLSASISAAFNFIDPNREERAWMLPTMMINIAAKYRTLKDKLTVKGELYVGNGMNFKLSDGSSDRGNPLLDVSIGADYMFSENFGGFLNVNNLAFNKYKVYQDYPTYGLNFIGGIIARF